MRVPVLPGSMPIASSAQLLRFSDACGAEIPRWIRLRLQEFGDDSAATLEICQRLGLGQASTNSSERVRAGVRQLTGQPGREGLVFHAHALEQFVQYQVDLRR